eukprot:6455064-Amphidinium_carterae.1
MLPRMQKRLNPFTHLSATSTHANPPSDRKDGDGAEFTRCPGNRRGVSRMNAMRCEGGLFRKHGDPTLRPLIRNERELFTTHHKATELSKSDIGESSKLVDIPAVEPGR